jgi:hypothetical protein
VKIKVGTKVRFDPFLQMSFNGANDLRGCIVTGTVVAVNEEHHWFSVEYGKPKQRTSFTFMDVGSVVKVCGK